MKLYFSIFYFFIIVILISNSFSKTINVPSDYSTIQTALISASEGDTIFVQPGTYFENINWPYINNLKLISAGDTSNTIIDGQNSGSVISISPNNVTIDSNTVIEGFKIINGGNVDYGAGIHITNASPVLKSLKITQNISNNCGGGIYIENSNSFLKNITISKNSAEWGGGIYVKNSGLLISDVKIYENSVENGETGIYCGGAGIYCNNSNLQNNNLQILNNFTKGNTGKGAGIYFYKFYSIFENAIIAGNTCSGNYGGGGIFCGTYFNGEFKDVVIVDNYSNNDGGGIYIGVNAELILRNTSLIDNFAKKNGGGIFIYKTSSGSIEIDNCLIYSNKADQNGDGIYYNDKSNVKFSSVNFINNGEGIYSRYDVDAPNLWWGDYFGPYHPQYNPNGKGDSLSYYVNAQPWLTAPDTSSPPTPIQNLKIIDYGDNYSTLSWDESDLSDVTGYNLYYSVNTPGFPYEKKIDVGNFTTYTLSNLSVGSKYYVSITCYDNYGNESWYSSEVIAEPTPAPIISTYSQSITFDTTLVGESSNEVLTIYNNGSASLNISNIQITNKQFVVQDTSIIILPNNKFDLEIKYMPTNFGKINSTLTIYSNAKNSQEYIIKLSGFGDISPNPVIKSIIDVPEDQGGQVRIIFERSKYDGLDSSQQIQTYSIWRKNEENWDAIGMFNAVQDSVYNFVAPTLKDSTVEGIYWSYFRISAHTKNPDIFYYSDEARGYSIDNIAPATPEGFKIQISNEQVILSWNKVDEKDFQYYGIYRSTKSGFNPDTMETFSFVTIDTFMIDKNIIKDKDYYYRISAVDYAGNISSYSVELHAILTDIENNEDKIPHEFSVSQNFPNPFNPSTTITINLPISAKVTIEIFNSIGQIVKDILVNKNMHPGKHIININGEDLPSGVYFYTVKAGSYFQVKKMIILR